MRQCVQFLVRTKIPFTPHFFAALRQPLHIKSPFFVLKTKFYSCEMYSLRPKPIDFPKIWAELEPTVLQIVTLQPISRLAWNHKFSDIYDICVAIPDSFSDKLYRSVQTSLKNHLDQQYDIIDKVNFEDLLQEYYKAWKIYYEGSQYVHNLFGYLNKQFVKNRKSTEVDGYQSFMPFLNQPDVKEIGNLALEIWRTRLLEPILEQLVTLLLGAIAQDREGKNVTNKETVAGVINSFVLVEELCFGREDNDNRCTITNYQRQSPYAFYQESFESRFLAATKEYYTNLAHQLLAENSCSEYMEKLRE